MDNRRKFLKGLGLIGAFASGAAASSVVANNIPMDIKQDTSGLEPTGSHTIVLTADNAPPAPPDEPIQWQERMRLGPNGFSFTPSVVDYSSAIVPVATTAIPTWYSVKNSQPSNSVKLSVGRDDRLWINVGGTWRRVALE